MSNYGKTYERATDIASTLMERDYKGFGRQSQTAVVEKRCKDHS